jgi:predicted transcriptional regulator
VTTVVAAFVIVAAVAIVVQMGILLALYMAMRQTASRMEGIAGRLEQQTTPLLANAAAILEDAKPKIAEITTNLAESTATVRAHVTHVTEASGEIVERARRHALRMDEFVGSTMGKIETASEILETKVLSPVRRVQGIIAAINAGLGILKAAKGTKQPPRHSHPVEEDEEMFI